VPQPGGLNVGLCPASSFGCYVGVNCALVVAAGFYYTSKEKAVQPAVQSVSLSPALMIDYLTVESRLEKPTRGAHVLLLTML